MILSSAGSSYDSGYGIYSGGALSLAYNLQGEGEYTVTTTAAVATNSTQKLIAITATLGIGTQSSYQYVSLANSGKATVKIENGKYHISIPDPISLKKNIVIGGAQSVPETIKLTIENGYVK